jgi:outer membrane lipoprotein-sorting protein
MTLRTLTLAAALTLTPLAALSQSQLNSVLDQMNAASARFKNVQADARYDEYTRVVNDHDISTGSLYVERKGSTVHMGALQYNLGPNGQPDKSPARIINFDGNNLRLYTPGNGQVDLFKAGANQAKYDSFLTLGFGGSGDDLKSAWNITDQGSETIAGIATEKLDLVSKDPGVKQTFTHVTIWIDPKRGVSLKQIFYAPGGDSRTTTYTNIRLNSNINEKPYQIPTKGVNVIAH